MVHGSEARRLDRLVLGALLVGALTGCGAAGGAETTAPPEDPRGGTAAAAAAPASAPPSATPRTDAPLPTPEGTGSTSSATSPAASSAAAAAAGRIQDPTSSVEVPVTTEAPTRVRIPSIGVDAPLEVLSVDADDALQPPVAWEAAGWYDGSPVPGERGPAVIAGHLVGPTDAAVFVDLGSLAPGDLVSVDRADGTSATFAVDRTISAERTDSFPTSEIYGPTPDAQLRLITCDGEYDPSRGHWTRNMVVFASEVGP
ncbi:hypothetical protein AC792_09575 [Arthrobacter sp. RIT-PI-e]|uniref:sortase domain-containing protein n=1 Tax=Arthrobacter sp. RIT-PI-e TaxID=1681197 RepID=UPI00067680C1|nr:sortase [Arthrobacter sp. RIT-PI-e]KNC18936.1 hypothetical protein AC792_09575 [Arthrobacter sp. RIT-PI-e]